MTPKYLYKYMRVEKRRPAVRKLLKHGELRFSLRSEFNDPYDCQPVFSSEYTRESFRRHLLRIVRETNPDASQGAIRLRVAQLMEEHYPPSQDRLKEMAAEYRARIEKVGVSCFTERNDSVVMWAHYADNHRGICVQFNVKAVGRFSAVEYQERRPVIKLIGGSAYTSGQPMPLTARA